MFHFGHVGFMTDLWVDAAKPTSLQTSRWLWQVKNTMGVRVSRSFLFAGRFRVEFQHQPPPFDVLCFYLTWISMVLISWSPFSSQSFPSTIDQPHFSKGVSLLLRNLLAFFTGRSNTCQEGSKLLSPVVVQFCPQVSGNYLDLSKDAWLVCNFCKALFF